MMKNEDYRPRPRPLAIYLQTSSASETNKYVYINEISVRSVEAWKQSKIVLTSQYVPKWKNEMGGLLHTEYVIGSYQSPNTPNYSSLLIMNNNGVRFITKGKHILSFAAKIVAKLYDDLGSCFWLSMRKTYPTMFQGESDLFSNYSIWKLHNLTPSLFPFVIDKSGSSLLFWVNDKQSPVKITKQLRK